MGKSNIYYALSIPLIRNHKVNNGCYGIECSVALCLGDKLLLIAVLSALLTFVIRSLLLIMR